MKLCIGVSCTTSLTTRSGGLHYKLFASITAFFFFLFFFAGHRLGHVNMPLPLTM